MPNPLYTCEVSQLRSRGASHDLLQSICRSHLSITRKFKRVLLQCTLERKMREAETQRGCFFDFQNFVSKSIRFHSSLQPKCEFRGLRSAKKPEEALRALSGLSKFTRSLASCERRAGTPRRFFFGDVARPVKGFRAGPYMHRLRFLSACTD